MKDFVLEQRKNSDTANSFRSRCCKYANFLNQPLTLGMFVPCDLEGNVLEEPKGFSEFMPKRDTDDAFFGRVVGLAKGSPFYEYQQAKESVLFEGWQMENDLDSIWLNKAGTDENFCFYMPDTDNSKTVEDLIRFSDEYPTELTKSAIKQIQLC